MKVVILAGGMGSRLAEQTDVLPKPMVEIGSKPILWHIMTHLASYGLNDFVIALGYRGQDIKRYFIDYCKLTSDLTIKLRSGDVMRHERNGASNWRVELIDTGQHTQTGGRLKRVAESLDGGPFMMTYGDGVSDVDVSKLLAFHRKQGKAVTLTAVRPPARFGHMTFDADGTTITQFTEKPQTESGWINGGFFVLEKKVLDWIDGDETWFEREPLERAAAARQLAAYKHDGFWQCLDTVRDRRLLEELWESGGAPWRTESTEPAGTGRAAVQTGGRGSGA
jgi:glucose-1-phosphate cytidylyltransferase